LLTAVACGGADGEDDSDVAATEVVPLETDPVDAAPVERGRLSSSLDDLSPELQQIREPWTGDLDGMAERRHVRVLTAHNPMFYTLDGADQSGIVYEGAVLFEKFLSEYLKRGRLKVQVVIIPVPRDALIPALVEGKGDVVMANLTITPERLELVDFSTPLMRDVSEIVVSGPKALNLRILDDLSGLEIHLRRSSSYWTSVERLNDAFDEMGMLPLHLSAVSPDLEDHDLLEMVNAGLLTFTVVDSHKAQFWERVFDHIVLHPDLAVREGGEIGWAFRKDSPKLREAVDAFVRKHRKGTLVGNVLYQRYLEDTAWVQDALGDGGTERLEETIGLFRKYGERYDIDSMLLAAQGYQESKLDQRTRSRAGAVGVMQLMPIAAKQVGITDIDDLENNIHAGAKYLRYLIDHYFHDESLTKHEKHLLALAAYNAGPTRIKRLRKETASKGLDPNRWFDNVEVVVARKVGSEPVRYVANIVKYYLAYKLLTGAEAGADV
jgi:membrane-bound lytic murein transglycosylase MltF